MFGGDFGSNSNFGASGGHVSDLQQRTDTANATFHAVAFAAPTSASTMERKITRPSAEPRADSTARWGWGMRPGTLLSRWLARGVVLAVRLVSHAMSVLSVG